MRHASMHHAQQSLCKQVGEGYQPPLLTVFHVGLSTAPVNLSNVLSLPGTQTTAAGPHPYHPLQNDHQEHLFPLHHHPSAHFPSLDEQHELYQKSQSFQLPHHSHAHARFHDSPPNKAEQEHAGRHGAQIAEI